MEKDFLPVLLKAILPEFDWVLSEMEKSGGWLNLSTPIIDNLSKIKIRWWEAYTDDKRFNIYQALMFIDFETLKNIQSEEDVRILNEALTDEAYELITSDEFKNTRPYTEEEKEKMVKELNEMLESYTEEERNQFWQQVGFYWIGFTITFFNLLSLMVHGKSLRRLVEAAQQGDNEAYVLAVQIDRTVLFLPYFQQRLQRAQLTKDVNFLDNLAYRIKNPIIKGKIRRRTLWLLFALLDSEGQLDMPLKELLSICEDVGLYGKEYGVGDENSLSKRRKEYRDNHGTRKIF